ncbi:hypothetical protein HYR99_06360 [Candidatus Poribacteria bacterium]|nr:hypothetical protein [Candidatus Poribacteria bacterium]
MEQTRELHGDVWNGVQFFLTVNAIIIAAIFTIFQLDKTPFDIRRIVAISLLAVVGLVLTVMALRILRGHREFYLGVLVRKSLLEKELGFYDVTLSCVDFSLPWQILPQDLTELIKDPIEWQRRWLWRGKVTPFLRYTYLVVIAIYVLILVALTACFIFPSK